MVKLFFHCAKQINYHSSTKQGQMNNVAILEVCWESYMTNSIDMEKYSFFTPVLGTLQGSPVIMDGNVSINVHMHILCHSKIAFASNARESLCSSKMRKH